MHQPQQVGQQERHEEVQENYQAFVADIIDSHREPVRQAVEVARQRQHGHSHAGGLHTHQRPPQPQHRRQHPQMPPHIARQSNDNEQNSQHHISSFLALGTKSTTVSSRNGVVGNPGTTTPNAPSPTASRPNTIYIYRFILATSVPKALQRYTFSRTCGNIFFCRMKYYSYFCTCFRERKL